MNITKELIQATVNYLAQRPYSEVAALIAEWKKQVDAQNKSPPEESEDGV